jgi:16S rRNA pseudouridine516 synthase
MELERLLRSQGFGSRPECRVLICSGQVSVGGTLCDDPYAQFDPEGFNFSIDGVQWSYRKFAYLVLNKPAGFECSQKPRHHPSVYSLLPRPLLTRGVQAVGRLDEDTSGMLLLSDDGQFIHTFTSPKKKIAKVYDVSVKHPVDTLQLEALLSGVQLNDEPAPVAATSCEIRSQRVLRMTVTAGKYHLVKRMIAAAGNRVEALNRVAIGGFELPLSLAPGQWMWLQAADLERLTLPGAIKQDVRC